MVPISRFKVFGLNAFIVVADSGEDVGSLGPRKHSKQTSYSLEVLNSLPTITLSHDMLVSFGYLDTSIQIENIRI
jgi:hypothetical protein